MSRSDTHLSETDIWPRAAKLHLVCAAAGDPRPHFARAPLCPALTHHFIRHAAVAELPAPFRIVRTQLGGSYFLASLAGAGKVLVDGRWLTCRAGYAALLPPGTLQAFHALPRTVWKIAWVRYQEQPGQRPLATAQTPIIARYHGLPLEQAILGLHAECAGPAVPALMTPWASLIQTYVERFVRPTQRDERLWKLWQRVAESLADQWTLAAMSQETHVGEKQLQRLCRQQFGRTPRQQLIWLRMRRAAELLADPALKIETIARRVGYDNPFVFSSTFKRVMGWSPSAYPGRA
jgi:AraC-like DNA-binding protein